MKRLYDWFTNMYDEFDDDAGEWKGKRRLYLDSTPTEKGNGIRIIVICDDNEGGTISYIQDIYEGSDYKADDDIFAVITKTVTDIMENMP